MKYQHFMVCATCLLLLVLCAMLVPWIKEPAGIYSAMGAAIYFGARSSTYLLKRRKA